MSRGHLLRAALSAALVASCQASALQPRVTTGECSTTATESVGTYFPAQMQVQADPTLAQLFDLKYASNFKVLTSTLAKEQYVLTQCGQPAPSDADVDAVAALASGYVRKHFDVPVETAAVMTTVEESYGNSTKHAEQLASVDVVFLDCGTNCATVNARANAVHSPVTQDPSPIASAEYIKFVAAFFNMESEANTIFEAMKTSYNQFASAAAAAAQPPVVAWINWDSWNNKFVVSQAAYKLKMVTDVGASNFDAASKLAGFAVTDAVATIPAAGKTYSLAVTGGKQNTSDAFFAALTDVDVVIDEVYSADPATYNFQSFLDAYGLQSNSQLKFVTNQMVLRIDRTLNAANNGWAWFETRVSHPTGALEGLARVLYKDNSKTARYFRNVASGETPDQLLEANACVTALPVCSAGTLPKPILHYTTTTTTGEVSRAAVWRWPVLTAAAALGLAALRA